MLSVPRARAAALALAAGLALAGSAPVAQAQCFGPDLLDIGPCCAATLPNLPPFPAVSLPGLNICFQQCTTSATRTLKVSWTPPLQVFCGEFTSTLLVSDAGSGTPLLTGTLTLDYTRTWDEVDPSGTPTQVWRFVAKADLGQVPGSPPLPCSLPPCIAPAGPHPTAFYYGYMDYTVCGAVGGIFQNALVLFHNCDRFVHMAGLSDKPGVFHPGGSFAIVAPHDSIQPFVPGNVIAPSGPVFGEAVRDVNTSTPPPNPCTVEDHVLQANMAKLGAGCVCTMTIVPKQQTLRQFSGVTQCVNSAGINGGWQSLNVAFPTLPWFHMVTTSIGRWTNPNVYPGQEHAWVDEGLFVHQSACNGDWVELKYGGSTRGGFTAILPVPVQVTNFTDLADNYTAPLFGPYPTPILGSVRPTDHLIYVNEP